MNKAWHPAFVAATGIELTKEENVLQVPEKVLGKEPLRIDLFIQIPEEEKIENEIGHLFRRYNVLEYKSPEDGLSIDDFFKTIGYACLLKGLGDRVDEYPEDEITISIVRDTYPKGLFEYLAETGRSVEEKYPGIYYISGNVQFPAQIIVTSRLDQKHVSLRILSNHACEEDIKKFIEMTGKMTRPRDRNNADAVLQVSASANKELYEKIRRESEMSCEALRELMKEDLENEREKGREQGERLGREQGEKIGREQGEKIGREQGEKIGREQGEKIGREQGEKIGREQGEKIGREKERENGLRLLITVCKEVGIQFSDTVTKVAASYMLPVDAAAESVRKYW